MEVEKGGRRKRKKKKKKKTMTRSTQRKSRGVERILLR
jgi:hypothetical protein